MLHRGIGRAKIGSMIEVERDAPDGKVSGSVTSISAPAEGVRHDAQRGVTIQ